MSMAAGGFEVTAWNEETYQELADGAKLTRATVSETFTGDIVGEGIFEWLMCYRPDGTAHFVGFLRIAGSLRGRPGSFVIESIGGTWSRDPAPSRSPTSPAPVASTPRSAPRAPTSSIPARSDRKQVRDLSSWCRRGDLNPHEP